MIGGVKENIESHFLQSYNLDLLLDDKSKVIEEQIPFDFGALSGKRNMYYFEGGMIFHVFFDVKEDFVLYAENNTPMIKLSFCLKGEIFAQLENNPFVFHRAESTTSLTYIPECKGHYNLKKGQQIEFVDICLTETYFFELIQRYPSVFKEFDKAIAEKRLFQLQELPIQITLKMKSVLKDTLACKHEDHLSKLSLDNKILELLVLQIEQKAHAQQCHNHTCICKTQEDFDKLYLAKDILLSQYQNPPSILVLAKKVGLNDFKLKKGFKEIYSNTVHGYLTDYKMNVALELMDKKKFSVAEICYQLGYESPSHFSRLFKRKFGVTPSDKQKSI
jgi:AraC-like DNA-binding protein